MNRYFSCTLIVALIACCIILPASAVIQEATVKGTITTMDPSRNMITIANPLQYGCVYAASGSTICTYDSMNISSLTGTAPDPSAFSVFKTGDPVVATSLGGAGETWIALAKLFGSQPSELYVTDIVGDATTIPTPLAGNYTLVLSTNPDCSACTGTTCTAVSSDVAIRGDGRQLAARTLKPGEALGFNGRNDGSSIVVTFMKGQALSSSCTNRPAGMVGGIQPISDYIVHVVPPIGMTVDQMQASGPAPTLATLSAAPSAPVTPARTQKSGSLPVAVIGALGVIVLIAAVQKK
ncbi:hypothetical protein [uncultured Methanoregula sp.]|uniref:hypothetical protein n=1 Tax=uncultured Methanoregula sp. TaxID=1005933 RepID=UPI002AAC3763|nr:hypothetical protein [uncultured Methanoregula sp.]